VEVNQIGCAATGGDDGTTADSSIPVAVSGLGKVTTIAPGGYHI
jgi:hypothetical protein